MTSSIPPKAAVSRYRFELKRAWGDGPSICWVMLNPSTADEENDDPTIRRVLAFSKGWGYGSLSVVNLFALRATNPHDLLTADRPIGAENDEVIQRCATAAWERVAAWGNVPVRLRGRIAQVRRLTGSMTCLGHNKDGQPKHPLYVPGNAFLEPL